jgi:hypothetical protein
LKVAPDTLQGPLAVDLNPAVVIHPDLVALQNQGPLLQDHLAHHPAVHLVVHPAVHPEEAGRKF